MQDLMTEMYVRLTNATKREEGQGLVEYALIIVLISVVLIGALGSLAGGINGAFDKIIAALVPPAAL